MPAAVADRRSDARQNCQSEGNTDLLCGVEQCRGNSGLGVLLVIYDGLGPRCGKNGDAQWLGPSVAVGPRFLEPERASVAMFEHEVGLGTCDGRIR